MIQDKRDMKDSGVDWLGEIPAHWDIVDLSRLANYVNGAAFKPSEWSEEGLPIIRIQNLTGVSDHYNYFQGIRPLQYRIQQGDMLISWSASIGVFVWNGGEAWLNQHIFKVENLSELVTSQYFVYSLRNSIGAIKSQTHGSTMKHIVRGDFLRTKVTLPPLHEQRAIAAYLDTETARIDALIAKTERLTTLLREKRTALISQAVTKGLDAGVAMKDSGVEWLGEIPAHWEVSSLRHAVTIHDERRIPLNGEQRADIQGDYPYCGANGIVDHIDDYIFDGEYVLLAEDGGYWGQHERSAYRMSGRFWVNNHAHILQSIPCKSDIDFVCYILIHADIDSCITGSTRGKLNQSAMKSIPLPLPPLHEQRAIADRLDRETARIDALIAKNDRLIALLREKRSALISAAVTGKLAVSSVVKQ